MGVIPRLVKVEEGLWVDPDKVCFVRSRQDGGSWIETGSEKDCAATRQAELAPDAVAAIINAHREKRMPQPALNLFPDKDKRKPGPAADISSEADY